MTGRTCWISAARSLVKTRRVTSLRFSSESRRACPPQILVDSTEADVVEEALKRIPGKAIINSINLEDGEKRVATRSRIVVM